MSRHKNPRLNTRNWEDYMDADGLETANFEKLRHHQHTDRADDMKPAAKARQNFHRARFN